MMDWWNGLAASLQIFYGIGIIATALLIIQLLMTLFGIDDQGDAVDGLDGMDAMDGMDVMDGMDAMDAGDHLDAAGHAEHSSGLQVLSFRSVVAFLAGFGWTGAFALRQSSSMPLSVISAFIVGTILMFLIYYLMRMLYGLRHSGSLNYANAIGQIADVYIRIPPERNGEGQVQVMVQGRLSTVPASTTDTEEIPSGSKVQVVKLDSPRTLLVKAIKEKPTKPANEE